MPLDVESLVARDGSRIGYTTFGAGRPAVLLVSWRTTLQQQLESAESAPFYAELALRLQISAYDRRGVGSSSRDLNSAPIDAQLDDVSLVMEAMALTTADLIADNDACYVAIRFAARHPNRVRRLVLWSPLVGGHDARPEEMRAFAQLMRRDYQSACYKWAEASVPGGSEVERRSAAKLFESQRSGAVAANYMEWEAAEDVSDVLPTVTAPTLVIAPRRRGARSIGVASMLQDARFETVDADLATGAMDLTDVARRVSAFLLESPGLRR